MATNVFIPAMKTINFQNFFLASDFLNVEFEFSQENVTFKAHSKILASTNKVFQKMFVDSSDKNDFKIKIDNYDYKTFKTFLRYLYTGEFEVKEISVELLACVKEYSEENLIRVFEKELEKKITIENVSSILSKATDLKCENLKNKALGYVKRNYTKFMIHYHELICKNEMFRKEIFKILEESYKNPSMYNNKKK